MIEYAEPNCCSGTIFGTAGHNTLGNKENATPKNILLVAANWKSGQQLTQRLTQIMGLFKRHNPPIQR